MRRLLFGVLIGVLMLSPVTTAAEQEGAAFDDVPPWHWAFEAVQRLGAAAS